MIHDTYIVFSFFFVYLSGGNKVEYKISLLCLFYLYRSIYLLPTFLPANRFVVLPTSIYLPTYPPTTYLPTHLLIYLSVYLIRL